MEKTLSQEERIRRAEEIYYRRKINNNDVRMPSSQVKQTNEKRQISLYRKMLIQILICVLIYLIFSLIKEANYIFSDNVINSTKQFLNRDISFEEISEKANEFWQNNKEKFNFFINSTDEDGVENELNIQINEQQNINEKLNNELNNEQQSVEEKTSQIDTIDLGIGGGTENDQTIQTSADEPSKKTQMEIDSEYIKSNFKMQLPAKGVITSKYGQREATEIISANHQGIDIGISTGTIIVAAMEGTVSLISDEGSYGKHVKIINKDVTTIYAHCSKILVKKGDKIKIGQKIALSGNTGNTTGPHLHFEIRREERTINPELILNWG